MGHEMKRISVLFLLITVCLTAQAQGTAVESFVIDKSKPYVYLQFDHVGPRKPIQSDEGSIGLWVRVVNNCRIPIVLQSFSMPQGVPGVGLFDAVVENEPVLQIFSTPEEGREIQRKERLRKAKHKPKGYSSETTGVTRIQPGSEILFSVPLNHVDDDWHMQVRFALDLNSSSVASGPFTYLPFYEWDIPKEFRSPKVPTP
jgi:hypothetical protein